MKKIYFVVILAFGLVASTNAQFTDDIENYPLGPVSNGATGPWGDWDGNNGTGDDIEVSDDQALSGTKSILIAEGTAIDGVLDLGDKTSGTWFLTYNMYIPSGKSGYFNIQNTVQPVGTQWNFHCTFDNSGGFEFADASGANQGPGTVLGSGSYPFDQWFLVSLVVDLDNLIMDVKINGVDVTIGTPYTGDTLGGINFYALETDNRYYIDDARLADSILGVDDFSADVFSVYPNPVQDVLNIKSAAAVNEVVVYDILGKVVLQSHPDAISPSINMSGLNAGAYMVKVTIDGVSKTTKVIK